MVCAGKESVLGCLEVVVLPGASMEVRASRGLLPQWWAGESQAGNRAASTRKEVETEAKSKEKREGEQILSGLCLLPLACCEQEAEDCVVLGLGAHGTLATTA